MVSPPPLTKDAGRTVPNLRWATDNGNARPHRSQTGVWPPPGGGGHLGVPGREQQQRYGATTLTASSGKSLLAGRFSALNTHRAGDS